MNVLCSVCGKAYPAQTLGRCRVCRGILATAYSDAAVQALATIPAGRGIDRYRALLPVTTPVPFLGEGDSI